MASINTTQISRGDDQSPEAIRSDLEAMIARHCDDQGDVSDDELEPVMRSLIEKIAPTRADLDDLVDRLPPSNINYAEEDDELPC